MSQKAQKASPFGRGGIAQAMTERASPPPESRYAAISRFFDRAMLSLRLFLSVGVLALSVTFGASSPKGGASGVPVRPTRDEQSLIFSETVVPCYRDSQQLDKVFLSISCCPL